jgi:hypothetical protein
MPTSASLGCPDVVTGTLPVDSYDALVLFDYGATYSFVSLGLQIRLSYLVKRLDSQWLMTHKYRGSQKSSWEVKPKFIDSTQGEPKNIYKP